jgi:hypothetical protein
MALKSRQPQQPAAVNKPVSGSNGSSSTSTVAVKETRRQEVRREEEQRVCFLDYVYWLVVTFPMSSEIFDYSLFLISN